MMRGAGGGVLLLLAACATGPGYDETLERIRHGTAEERYHAVLDLGRHRKAREVLAGLLLSEEPMTRNAAARVLCGWGDRDAAFTLIANLHRDERTYVCADAIWHLKELYGTDRGYDPNLGYRHQTEKQAEWWAWLGEDPPPEPEESVDAGISRRTIEEGLRRGGAVDAAWESVAAHHGSRHLADVAFRERVFGAMLEIRPKDPDLLNNHALAALQNGHPGPARVSYEKALALVPDDPQLRNDYGILLEAVGLLDQAAREYREAVRWKPDDDVAWANLGDVYRKQGRRTQALEAYREAERLATSKWFYHRLWIGRLR